MAIDQKSLVGGICFLMLASSVCVGSYKMGLGSLRAPGPGFFPFITGLVLVLLSVVEVIFSLFFKPAEVKNLFSLWQGVHWGKAALLFFGTFVYVQVLSILGFLVSTLLFIGFCVRLVSRRTWFITAIASILTTFGFYFLLLYFLKLPVPRGFLGF